MNKNEEMFKNAIGVWQIEMLVKLSKLQYLHSGWNFRRVYKLLECNFNWIREQKKDPAYFMSFLTFLQVCTRFRALGSNFNNNTGIFFSVLSVCNLVGRKKTIRQKIKIYQRCLHSYTFKPEVFYVRHVRNIGILEFNMGIPISHNLYRNTEYYGYLSIFFISGLPFSLSSFQFLLPSNKKKSYSNRLWWWQAKIVFAKGQKRRIY